MILMVIVLCLHMVSFCSLNMFVIPDLTSYLLKCDIWSSHRQLLFLFFFLNPLYRFTFLFHFLLLKNAYFRKCILSISVGLIFLATKINQKSYSFVPVTGQNLWSHFTEGGVLDVHLIIREWQWFSQSDLFVILPASDTQLISSIHCLLSVVLLWTNAQYIEYPMVSSD